LARFTAAATPSAMSARSSSRIISTAAPSPILVISFAPVRVLLATGAELLTALFESLRRCGERTRLRPAMAPVSGAL
jgi:hypothetical protein